MEFVPKSIEGNNNVSDTHPLKELVTLAGGILGALVLLYVILGLLVHLIVPHISPRVERKIGSFYSSLYEGAEPDSETDVYLQGILDRLQEKMEKQPVDYRVHLVDSDEANAYALPGGHIVVCSGLLEVIQSENEMAMILAHELGHFINRDHLLRIGRSLLFSIVSVIVFGEQSSVSRWFQGLLGSVEAGFSKYQETRADSYGLELLEKTYGHVSGSTDFFKHMQKRKHDSRFLALFATHPYSETRIVILEEHIQEKNMAVKTNLPLPDCITQYQKESEEEESEEVEQND